MTETQRIVRVTLRPGGDRRVRQGHLWVYEGEIAEASAQPAAGACVDVVSHRGHYLGRGLFHPHSRIRVRLLTFDQEPIDEAFFVRRIRAAVALRQRVVADTTAYRVVFGEGDLLPGLIVDRYNDVLVVQTLTVGMDVRAEMLADILSRETAVRAVYVRNDAESRLLEGLPQYRGWLRGRADARQEIREADTRFVVDVEGGQKTGWFCDQRENRLAVAPLAGDAEVLEPFAYTGAFGIHCALRGARSVLGFDRSGPAVEQAREHAVHNDVAQVCAYEVADAFDQMRALVRAGRCFDVVILDPPAFARRAAAVPRALAGYRDINLWALRLLRPGGFLVTCSCSYHVDEAMLWNAVLDAAADAGRRLRLLEARGQARDHPMLAAMPETRYLKCFVLHVVD
ncbi:MAG: class I SAM-dependent rRNA methyltransferase [Armatimonadota bacterium]|nr:class I SAM-dependent rRNA methyltransferase [Armatimonadota bacterium]MDR5696315.1 class I SAM-dependent rRNA methyltransferase [Armatimonadota bacterium]